MKKLFLLPAILSFFLLPALPAKAIPISIGIILDARDLEGRHNDCDRYCRRQRDHQERRRNEEDNDYYQNRNRQDRQVYTCFLNGYQVPCSVSEVSNQNNRDHYNNNSSNNNPTNNTCRPSPYCRR